MPRSRSARPPKQEKVLTPEQAIRRARREKLHNEAELRAVQFKVLCAQQGLPMPTREFRFAAPDRDWRADFAWEPERVILEVEGGAWSGGRHTRGSGYVADMEKYNAMTVRGWKLLRCVPKALCTDATITLLRAVLNPESPVRPPIPPALSAEEWRAYAPMGIVVPSPLVSTQPNFDLTDVEVERRHALAALCLYGQPFGFSQADVAYLRDLALVFDKRDVLLSIAARISALLPPPPPETPSSRRGTP